MLTLPLQLVWLQFKHQWVRELAFSIASPPLLAHWPASLQLETPHTDPIPSIDLPDANFWQQQFANYLPRLQQLDTNPQALERHMQNLRSWRIGICFEHLLTFWLQDSAYHPFTLLGQGIKRMDGQHTVGEIDFLILNQDTQKIEHWEVAIKFYLGEGKLQPEQWLGLNRRDSLDRKLKHVCQHQFDVADVHGYSIDQRRAIIKGRLFYPAMDFSTFALHPAWATPQHLNGSWGNIMPKIPQGFTWRYVSRQEWMVAQPNSVLTASKHTFTIDPIYWRTGLYLLLDAENKVVLQHMLRITDKSHKFLNNDNTLKPNPNAADIFNQISII